MWGLHLVKKFKVMNTFMVRVPCLAVDNHFDLITKNDNKEFLMDLLSNSDYKKLLEAIQVCSQSLYCSILNLKNGKEPRNKNHFLNSVYKYFIRASSRCTPFGLFSGVNFGQFSDSKTNFKLDDCPFVRYLRPDMLWLMKLIKKIESSCPNKVLYKLNEAVVVKRKRAYLVSSTVKNEKNDIAESSVSYTNAFKLIEKIVSDDYVTFEDIVKKMKQSAGNCSESVIFDYVKNLIENEYLISNLRPPLTNSNPFEYFVMEFEKTTKDTVLLKKLKKILAEIDLYNKCSTLDKDGLYQRLICDMEDIFYSESYLQVDSKVILKEKNLNINVENEINSLLDVLIKLNNENIAFGYWIEYKKKFLDSYGENRVVPLVEVLDDVYGIGFPDFDKKIMSNFSSKINAYLGEKYCSALKSGACEIEIKDSDIADLDLDDCNFEYIPESLELNFCLLRDARNCYYFELGEICGAVVAGKSFGRFSQMMDDSKKFFKKINDSLKDNYEDECVTCEISFLPHNERLANVVCNSHVSDYEISFSATNSRDKKEQIKLSDILIGIENNNFYLKSKSLNKRILITMNSMVNPSLCPDIVKFFYDLTIQEKIFWYNLPWKSMFNDYSYIPKIKYKKFILQSERWKVNSKLLRLNKKCNFEKFLSQFEKYRLKYSIPSHVYIQENIDNRLLVNLDNRRCLMILYNMLCAKSTTVWLCRCDKNSLATVDSDSGGKYCAEVFIPVLKNKIFESKSKKCINSAVIEDNTLDLLNTRVKKPFDDWLYFNLYGLDKDFIKLMCKIYDFLLPLKIENKISDYFFIRYKDPMEHIRLRINANKDNLVKIFLVFINWLCDLVDNFYIKKFTLDFYDRELERYGGASCINLAEKVFAVDSYVCCEIFKLRIKNEITIDNETLAILNILSHLDAFHLDNVEKLEFLERSTSFSANREEFKVKRQKFMKIGEKYITGFLEDKLSIILDLYKKRTARLSIYLDSIIKIYDDKIIKYSILDSLIHMSFNRCFGTDVDFEYKMRSITRHLVYALNSKAKNYFFNKVQ